MPNDYLEIAKLVVSSLTPLATICGLWFIGRQAKIAGKNLEISIVQNEKSQDWKRGEFVATEMSNFYEDTVVTAVLKMIDYESRYYPLGILRNGKSMLTIVVQGKDNPSMNKAASSVSIQSALDVNQSNLSPEETIIRDHFDVF